MHYFWTAPRILTVTTDVTEKINCSSSSIYSGSVKEALKICILRSFIICACHQILLGSNKRCMFLQFIDILINRGNTATIKQ